MASQVVTNGNFSIANIGGEPIIPQAIVFNGNNIVIEAKVGVIAEVAQGVIVFNGNNGNGNIVIGNAAVTVRADLSVLSPSYLDLLPRHQDDDDGAAGGTIALIGNHDPIAVGAA